MKLIKILVCVAMSVSLSAQNQAIYTSKAYSIYPDKVVQGNFTAKANSDSELQSNYRSPESDRYSPDISFKFSINCRDNEMLSGNDHLVTLCPVNNCCTTTVTFGQRMVQKKPIAKNQNLQENTRWTVRLNMRPVFNSFKKNGFFKLFDGSKLYRDDFKNVYIAGGSLPLIWDFNNLYTRPELELKDPDGDGIFETTLIMNQKDAGKKTEPVWKLTKDISAFPQYHSPFPITDAIYKLSTEEMIKAVEPDSTFRTGTEWAGVWTRDISYSIILSMAYLQPKVAEYSLMRKVSNNRIIQDTGTGGAYPVSTDRMVWAIAAWELYKATGDNNWLRKVYPIIKNSIEDDLHNALDPTTGMIRGESSFLDWREQTYPLWMQPADIFESECLGTNAVHYQANIVLSEMATLLNEPAVAVKHRSVANGIKNGINRYLWMEDKGYYGQYLYGRNYKILSPRSEALGEALCVLFGIADAKQAQRIIRNVPVMDYGISCIFPQIPGIPPYHNRAVWPFVQSYWALASAKSGNQQSVLESMAAIYRPAAMFLTDKENFVAETGDFAGTQINSGNMLWSLSGSLALVHKIIFGIHFDTDSLRLFPFVPENLKGIRALNNFKLRKANLNIEIQGFGQQISRFELDGQEKKSSAIPYDLEGTHHIRIQLENVNSFVKPIHKTNSYTTPATPIVKYKSGLLSWTKVKGAVKYQIVKNGELIASQPACRFVVSPNKTSEYQVVALDRMNVPSFASEPVLVVAKSDLQMISLAEKDRSYTEISKAVNPKIQIPIEISNAGNYSIQFRYTNGNGPVNTQNKCAIRTLKVDGQAIGTFVFPQRGTNEWKNWGSSNGIKLSLSKGSHQLELSFEPQNENMNIEVNQAQLEKVILCRIQ